MLINRHAETTDIDLFQGSIITAKITELAYSSQLLWCYKLRSWYQPCRLQGNRL